MHFLVDLYLQNEDFQFIELPLFYLLPFWFPFPDGLWAFPQRKKSDEYGE